MNKAPFLLYTVSISFSEVSVLFCEGVSRYRDPQLQVGKKHLHLCNLNQNICQCSKLNAHFSFTFFC